MTNTEKPIAHASSAEVYDLIYEESFGTFYKHLTDKNLEVISRVAQPPARILDIGAGTGRLSIPLARRGYEVAALEPCSEMLAELKRKAATAALEIETHNCAMAESINSQPFDLAICVFTVIAYMLDEATLSASFRRTASTLRKSGGLLIDVPQLVLFNSSAANTTKVARRVNITQAQNDIFDYRELTKVRRGEDWIEYKDNFQIRYWPKETVKRLLTDEGLSIERDFSDEFGSAYADYWLAVKR